MSEKKYMTEKKVKVIIDTNVWISFLIGKRLSNIKQRIVDGRILIITCEQLITEIRLVTSREKLKKYFQEEDVNELLQLLNIIGKKVEIKPTHFINRDPKDNFLLDLIDSSKADYLITGDKDLLEHNPFLSAKILTTSEFEAEIL